MKHAGPNTLAALEPLLRKVRQHPSLIERTPGSFYRKSRAYLHFHEDLTGIWADIKLDLNWFTRVRVTTPQEQARLLSLIAGSLREKHHGQNVSLAAECTLSTSAVRVIQVKVKPSARVSVLEETSPGVWLAQLKSPPVEGRANEELLALVSKHFACRRSAVSIKSGASGRMKLVRIESN